MNAIKKRDMFALVGLFLLVEGTIRLIECLMNYAETWPMAAGGALKVLAGAVLWFRNTNPKEEIVNHESGVGK